MNLVTTLKTKVSTSQALLITVTTYERSTTIAVGDQAELMTVAGMVHGPRKALRFLVQLLLQHVNPCLRERVAILLVQVDHVPTIVRDGLAIGAENHQRWDALDVEVLDEVLDVGVSEGQSWPRHGIEVGLERCLVVIARHEYDLEVLVIIMMIRLFAC